MYDDTVLVDKAYYNKLKEQTTWISVKDRLPEKGVDVLVYGDLFYNGKGIEVDYVKRGTFVTYDKDVTHWMPLPQKPESEE